MFCRLNKASELLSFHFFLILFGGVAEKVYLCSRKTQKAYKRRDARVAEEARLESV